MLARLFAGGGLALLAVTGAGCGASPFEQACLSLTPGTPLASAASALEAAGGRPTQGTDDIKVWLGRAMLRTPYCNVSIDSRDRVARTHFGKAFIVP